MTWKSVFRYVLWLLCICVGKPCRRLAESLVIKMIPTQVNFFVGSSYCIFIYLLIFCYFLVDKYMGRIWQKMISNRPANYKERKHQTLSILLLEKKRWDVNLAEILNPHDSHELLDEQFWIQNGYVSRPTDKSVGSIRQCVVDVVADQGCVLLGDYGTQNVLDHLAIDGAQFRRIFVGLLAQFYSCGM